MRCSTSPPLREQTASQSARPYTFAQTENEPCTSSRRELAARQLMYSTQANALIFPLSTVFFIGIAQENGALLSQQRTQPVSASA